MMIIHLVIDEQANVVSESLLPTSAMIDAKRRTENGEKVYVSHRET